MPRTALYLANIALLVSALVSTLVVVDGLQWLTGLPVPRLWGDFNSLYLVQLQHISLGYLPYRDFAYSFPPLFLYAMFPFYLVSPSLALIPILVADSLTCPIIYLLVKKHGGEKVAVITALGYSLSPFVLVNEGVLWLSSQPMTFFLLLSLWQLEEGRATRSLVLLSIAVLFKQEAVFVLPVYLYALAKRHRQDLIRASAGFVAAVAMVSAPFLVLAPGAYLFSLSYGLLPGVGAPGFAVSNVVGASTVNSLTPQLCTMTSFPGLFTGAVCGTGLDLGQLAFNLFMEKVNLHFLPIAEPLLTITFATAIWEVRRSPNLIPILSVFSMIAFLEAFSNVVHPVLGYYLVPVYALICSAVTDIKTSLAAILPLLLSTLLPDGVVQLMPPLLSVFVIIVLQSQMKK